METHLEKCRKFSMGLSAEEGEELVYLSLLGDHLTPLEHKDIQLGKKTIRKCATIEWFGEDIQVYGIKDSDTLEIIRTITIMASETVAWKKWINKCLKYIRLRVF